MNVALPALRDDLGASLADQQWVVEAYLLLASQILVGGSLGDLYVDEDDRRAEDAGDQREALGAVSFSTRRQLEGPLRAQDGGAIGLLRHAPARKPQGIVHLRPDVHGDERGFFVESCRANVWAQHGIDDVFVQDNHSRSRRGVLRGMHFSIGDGQASSCAVLAAGSCTLSSTCALHRRRTVSGSASSSSTSRATSCTSRSASHTASASCRRSPT